MANVWARDTISGKVAEIDERFLTLEPFASHLVLVKDGEKDYVAELYAPKSADEFVEAHPVKADVNEDSENASDAKKVK